MFWPIVLIGKINNAKADMSEVLEDKGVEVPENSKLADFADLIDNIESAASIADLIGEGF